MNAERPSSPAFALGSSSREAFVLEVGCGRTPSEVVMVLVLITHPPKFERHISSRRPVDALGVSRVTGAHSLEEACTESIGALEGCPIQSHDPTTRARALIGIRPEPRPPIYW